MFQWPPLDVSTGVGVLAQVNKFKQFYSDDHPMSVGGGGTSPGLKYREDREEGEGRGTDACDACETLLSHNFVCRQ